MTDGPPTVSAVVLNWESYEDTARCVTSLQTQSVENLRIIVVDNGSTDDSVSKLSATFGEDIELVRNENNLGFSGGMNVGVRAALDHDTDYVWLLNNDVIVPDEFRLEAITGYMDRNSSVGILSPRILGLDDEQSPWFEKGFIDERSGIATHNDIHKTVFTFRSPERIDRTGETIPSEYVPFASAFIQADVFDDVGLLPEEYFMYYEDVIYCTEVVEAGYTIRTFLDLHVFHEVNSSGSPKLAKYYQARNRIGYNTASGQLSVEFVLLNLWWALIMCARHALNHPTIFFTVLAGMIDGLRQKTGKGLYPK